MGETDGQGGMRRTRKEEGVINESRGVSRETDVNELEAGIMEEEEEIGG